MKVHTDLASFQGVPRPVLTTGTFDGVHLGHRTILHRLKELAKREEGESVLFTFHPHPRMVLFPNDNDLKLLSTQREKIAQLEAAGVDHLLVIPFSRTFSRMKALEYVRDVLVGALNVHAVVIGYDHRFGRNREGDMALLHQLGEAYDFLVEEIPAQEIDHVKVSSTKIRTGLASGRSPLWPTTCWAIAYSLTGVVVKGEQVGRTLGFPTANLGVVSGDKLVPGDGVYAVRVTLREGGFGGMLYIGERPTLGGGLQRTIEVNIFDMDRDLYGEPMTLTFLDRIRPDMRFSGLEALKEQLHLDRANALDILTRTA
jgi:riboflavin kinase/FMN adenylyltransferase